MCLDCGVLSVGLKIKGCDEVGLKGRDEVGLKIKGCDEASMKSTTEKPVVAFKAYTLI